MREKILERRSAVHERCKAEVEKRTQFEEGVRKESTYNPTDMFISLTSLTQLLFFLLSDQTSLLPCEAIGKSTVAKLAGVP